MGPKKRGRGSKNNRFYLAGENLTKEALLILKHGHSRGIKYLGLDDANDKPVEQKSFTDFEVVEPPKKPKENKKKKVPQINVSVKANPPPRKRFVDVTSQSSYNSSCIQKLALHKFVTNLVSRPNIASVVTITPDFVCYQMEFEKFLDFVYNFEEPGKSELARAIFPLFVLFYFNILQLSVSDAETFYDLFVYIFDSAEGYENILKELLAIKEKTHFLEHPYFSKFRDKKYILRISAEVLQELNTFLIDIESKALGQAFSYYFYYEDPDVELYRKTPKTSLTKPVEKPPRKPTKNVSGINYDHYYSFASKRSRLENKKPPPPVTASKNTKAVKAKRRFATLLTFEKELINRPPIIETYIEYPADISALDLNQNETEFTVSFGTPFIFISPMRKYFHLSYEKANDEPDDDDDYGLLNHECEDEISAKKVPLLDPVNAIKYFPNHPHLLLAASGTRIVKVNTDTETVTSFGIRGHIRAISDIDINSTASLFCSAGRDEICHLWNVNDTSLLRTYVGHENDVTTIKFHKNGIYLMSGSKDHTVRLWSIENAICLRTLVGHKSPVTLLTCSPDRKTVASADTDGIVKLWDINEALEYIPICDIQCYKGNQPDGSLVTSLSFGKENFLGMCNNRGVMRIWDIRKPNIIYNSISEGKEDEIIPVFLKSGYLRTWNIFFQQNVEQNVDSDEVQIECMEVDSY